MKWIKILLNVEHTNVFKDFWNFRFESIRYFRKTFTHFYKSLWEISSILLSYHLKLKKDKTWKDENNSIAQDDIVYQRFPKCD